MIEISELKIQLQHEKTTRRVGGHVSLKICRGGHPIFEHIKVFYLVYLYQLFSYTNYLGRVLSTKIGIKYKIKQHPTAPLEFSFIFLCIGLYKR